jgi:hypothetical protein
MNFGEWVRKEMNGMGKSVHWLMNEIGASGSMANKWRKGTKPKTEYFLKVCVIISREKKIPLMTTILMGAEKMGINLDD